MKKIISTITACISSAILLYSQPVANFTGSPTTVCPGQPVSWTNSSQGATTYQWSFPGATSTFANVQNPNPRIYNNPGTYDVMLIAILGNSRDTLLRKNYITVLSAPTLTVSPSPAQICSGGAGITLSVSGASSYTWSPATGLNTRTGDTVIANPTSSTTYTVVSNADSTCVGRTTVQVVVSSNPPPPAGPVNGPASVCSGQKGIVFSVPGVNAPAPVRTWTVPPGASIVSGQGTRFITVDFGSTSGNVCCVTSNGCGSATPSCMSVTVNPTPAVDTAGPIMGPASVCANQSGITYLIDSVSNATSYTWSVPTGASISSGQGTRSITVSFGTTAGNICVAAGNSCNSSQPRCFAVSVAPNAPAIPGTISGPAIICNGQSGITYSISPVANAASYTWTVPAGASISSGQGSNIINVNAGSTSGNICVSAANACGTTLPKCMTLTVNPTPPVDTVGIITGPAAVCANQSGITYSISAVVNASSYTWTVPTGAAIVSGQGTASITVDFGTSAGNVCVIAGNNCNTSQPGCLAVSVAPVAPAVPGTISGMAAICNADTGKIYSVTPVANATSYSWTVPSGASIVSGQGSSSVKINFGSASGDICVTASNACGTSLPKCLTVTVNPSPQVGSAGSITGDTEICGNQTGITYSISAVANASSYTWTVPSGASITAGQGTTSITVDFGTTGGNVCVVAGNSCNASQPECLAIVTVPVAPAIPGNITGSATVCNAQTGIVYSISAVPNATSYSWTVPAGASITAGQDSTAIIVGFGSTTGDVCVTASNACGTSLPKCLTVTVNPTSAVGTVGSINGLIAVCANQSGVSYSIPAVANASSYTWTVPSGASITSPQDTTFITVNFGTTAGNVCVTAGNSCNTSQPECLGINVATVPPAIPGTISGPATVCEDDSEITYSISSVPNTSSYSWTVPSGANIDFGQGTTSVSVAFGNTSGNICVTASNACGTSLGKCMGITVEPFPTLTVTASPATICTNGSTSLTGSGASTYMWMPAAGLSATTGSSVMAMPSTTTTYTVIGYSVSGCADTTTVTVSVQVCTGIISSAANQNVLIYPNPFSTHTIIKISENIVLSNASVTVFDLMGKKAAGIENINTYELKLERRDLPPGVYFYRIVNDNQVLSSGRIIIE